MRALPMPPKKVTELVPLPEQPPQVKVPEVEKVTGSALASDVARVTIARSNALISVAFKTPAMFTPLCYALDLRPHPSARDVIAWRVFSTRLKVDVSTVTGQARLWKHI